MLSEGNFLAVALEMDAALIDGMNVGISNGLAWAKMYIISALSLYVIGYAFMTMHGKVDSWTFVTAGIRAMAVGAILQAHNYNYYVRDFFFNDLPNQLARAINGPRITVNSAQQLDVAWSAVMHYTSFILAKASGWSQFDDRLMAWVFAGGDYLALWVCFGMWYMSRVFLSILISLGPFLIILFLFRTTRDYVQQWIGLMVGLTVLGLASAILLRMTLIVMSSRLRAFHLTPDISVTEMLSMSADVTGVFFLCALLMVVLPSAISIGSGMGAAHAMTGGLAYASGTAAGGTAMRVGGGAMRGAAYAGRRLGQFTGGR